VAATPCLARLERVLIEPVLQIEAAMGGYGDLTILHGVDLQIESGSWTTIIGANGAGKLRFASRDVTTLDVLARLRLGIGLVPQGRCNFPLLSVAENLKLGMFTRRLGKADLETELQRMTVRFPRLKERWNTLAGNLSGGEQQIMEMAMVLLARPTLLLLDEPSLGLSPHAMEMVFDTIRELCAAGITVLMVEQNARQALERCDWAVVMELGQTRLVDRASAVLSHPDIRRIFLGL
jgi:branched-chain amino acid transport system ATP-binding protein